MHIYASQALRSTFNLVSMMSEKALSGMLAETSWKDTIVKEPEETIRQKSISDITAQTTTEEELVPLPVSG